MTGFSCLCREVETEQGNYTISWRMGWTNGDIDDNGLWCFLKSCRLCGGSSNGWTDPEAHWRPAGLAWPVPDDGYTLLFGFSSSLLIPLCNLTLLSALHCSTLFLCLLSSSSCRLTFFFFLYTSIGAFISVWNREFKMNHTHSLVMSWIIDMLARYHHDMILDNHGVAHSPTSPLTVRIYLTSHII